MDITNTVDAHIIRNNPLANRGHFTWNFTTGEAITGPTTRLSTPQFLRSSERASGWQQLGSLGSVARSRARLASCQRNAARIEEGARASKTSSIAKTKRKRTQESPRSLTTARQTRLKNDLQPLVFQTGEIVSCWHCHEKLIVTEPALTGEHNIYNY